MFIGAYAYCQWAGFSLQLTFLIKKRLRGHVLLRENCRLPVGTINLSMGVGYNSPGSAVTPALQGHWGKMKAGQRSTAHLPSGALQHILFPKHFQENNLCWQPKRLSPVSPVYTLPWAFSMMVLEALAGFCVQALCCAAKLWTAAEVLWEISLPCVTSHGEKQPQPAPLSTRGCFQHSPSCEPCLEPCTGPCSVLLGGQQLITAHTHTYLDLLNLILPLRTTKLCFAGQEGKFTHLSLLNSWAECWSLICWSSLKMWTLLRCNSDFRLFFLPWN